jgi:hypothetical protein
METAGRFPYKQRYVLVKDRDGKEYVCKAEALKRPEELTAEERAACFEPPAAFE